MLLYYIFIAILGLIIGSFISAFTYRNPREISISDGRSRCPKCKREIAWYDNIPLLSYILLGGKCRNCGKKISLRYPAIEAGTAGVFLVVASQLGGEGGIGRLGFMLVVASILIAIFVIDLEHMIIPDSLVFILLGITFFYYILTSSYSPYTALLTGFLTSLLFLFLHLVTLGRGMGLGDVKLVIPLGMILGWPLAFVWLFLSFILGAVVGIILILSKKSSFGKHIAFGPFLVVGFFVALLWGERLLGFYPLNQ